jgi:hypothetical protein
MSAGNALKYGATGAVVGSALGPEGTVIGAGVGALAGALTGNGGGTDTSGGDASTGPRSNFTYGNTGPLSAAANRYAAGYDAQGQAAHDRATGYQNAAWNAQNRSGPQVQGNPQDRNFQLAALGGTNANAAALQGMGTAQQGPSVAEAQLRQGQDAAMQQSLALAHSGRSLGGGAAALQQAQFANAGTEQATNQQAAIARLQEQQQYHQFQLGALGAAQQGFGQAGQQAGALNASDVGLQAQNAGLQQQQQQVNNQTSATLGQVGQGLNQTGLQEQQLANSVRGTQLSAGEQYQNSINGNAIAGQQNQNAQTGMALGAVSGAANAYATYEGSDRDAKHNIVPAGAVDDPASTESPWTSWRALARQIGLTHAPAGPPPNPGALVRDPHNPSQLISPFAPIGAAAHAAGPDPSAQGQRMGADAERAQQNARALQYLQNAPVPEAPGTWGGEQTPIAPAFTPQAPDTSGLDAAYAQQSQPPPGFQISDERAKGNVRIAVTPSGSPYPDYAPAKQSPYQAISDASHYAGRVTFRPTGKDSYPGNAPYRASDEHSKTRIAELEGQLAALGGAAQRPAIQAPDTAALDDAYRREGGTPNPTQPSIDLRPARGYSYEYKEPERFGQGRFYGPMAQDLEKTPAGASTVKRGPDGTKMVDTSRLALVNTAAISDLQKQLAALDARGPQYPAPQAPDYGKIDLYRGMQQGGTY